MDYVDNYELALSWEKLTHIFVCFKIRRSKNLEIYQYISPTQTIMGSAPYTHKLCSEKRTKVISSLFAHTCKFKSLLQFLSLPVININLNINKLYPCYTTLLALGKQHQTRPPNKQKTYALVYGHIQTQI